MVKEITVEWDDMSIPRKPFYFIRHGETDWNRDAIIMGHTDIPLNTTGVQQAYHAQKFFKGLSFDRIYTSPLKRAYRTAEILGESLQNSLVISDGLTERGWGEHQGSAHASLSSLKDSELPNGAETLDEFKMRVFTAMQEILTASELPPLIVAHGGVFAVLAKHCVDQNIGTANCKPVFFRPPTNSSDLWCICNLDY